MRNQTAKSEKSVGSWKGEGGEGDIGGAHREGIFTIVDTRRLPAGAVCHFLAGRRLTNNLTSFNL